MDMRSFCPMGTSAAARTVPGKVVSIHETSKSKGEEGEGPVVAGIECLKN